MSLTDHTTIYPDPRQILKATLKMSNNEEIHFTRSFGNIPRIFRAICIAAQMLHLLIFP